LIHQNPGNRWGINSISLSLEDDTLLSLPVLNRNSWNELAVKKVLQIFAYGGHPRPSQISTWANMGPKDAIKEMLNFEPHNLKLSPLATGEKYPESASLDGTFWGFREYMSDLGSNLPIAIDPEGNNYERVALGVDAYDSQGAWVRMTTTRGLNPFRQKIGFWETNYHLAVNLDAGVTNRQLTRYYDVIMNAHAAGLPYQQIIATAAKSAAVTRQYDHAVENVNVRSEDANMWVPTVYRDLPWNQQLDFDNMHCQCNEDFAREIHQLFFGILGTQDLEHHESVTIPETAKALTDMRIPYDNANERFPEVVVFGTEYHHAGPVNILNTVINGNNAAEKIDAIAEVAINHPESLDNLPIKIISGLADDNLSQTEIDQLRTAWSSMNEKNFLEFIQAYAVSELFHSANRVKFATSIDRFMSLGNKLILNNTESLSDQYQLGASWSGARSFSAENVSVFRPQHNVFGGQTGIEASDSQSVFENNYNRFVDNAWSQSNSSCDDCDNGQEWRKDWASVIPKKNGVYKADDVAEWLWEHFIDDNGENYTQLERAHILPLISVKRDLNQIYCVQQRRIAEQIQPEQWEIDRNLSPLETILKDYSGVNSTGHRCDDNLNAAEIQLLEHGFTIAELESADMVVLLDEMADSTLLLDSSDLEEREEANKRVGQAINFILSTPFLMAQEAL